MKLASLALLAVVAVCSLGPRTPASAQQDQATVVQIAALEAVRSEFPAGRIKIDRGMHSPRAGLLSDAPVRALADAVGGTIGSQADITCPGGSPRGCRIDGADALVGIAEPTVRRDSATVVIRSRYHTGSDRQPVGAKDLRVTLIRSAGRWISTGVTVLRIS